MQGALLQINLSTHHVNTFDVVPDGQKGGGIWTSVSVNESTNTLYVSTGNAGTSKLQDQPHAEAILALDASSLALTDSWQVPTGQAIPDGDWGTTLALTDTAGGIPLAVAVNKNGLMYAFNQSCLSQSSCGGRGGPLWEDQIAIAGANPEAGQGTASSTSVGAGMFFQAGGVTNIYGITYTGAIREVDPNTGAYDWQQGTAAPIVPASSYANGLDIDGDGPYLQVRNASTGSLLYQFQTGDTIHGPATVSNGQIFVGSTDYKVYAFGLKS